MESIRSNTHKARKNHICDYCGQFILKGNKYSRQVNKQDGYLYTWKNHFACEKLATKLKMYDHCDDGLTMDDFQEYISVEFDNFLFENHNEIRASELYNLPPYKIMLLTLLSVNGICYSEFKTN